MGVFFCPQTAERLQHSRSTQTRQDVRRCLYVRQQNDGCAGQRRQPCPYPTGGTLRLLISTKPQHFVQESYSVVTKKQVKKTYIRTILHENCTSNFLIENDPPPISLGTKYCQTQHYKKLCQLFPSHYQANHSAHLYLQ